MVTGDARLSDARLSDALDSDALHDEIVPRTVIPGSHVGRIPRSAAGAHCLGGRTAERFVEPCCRDNR